MAPEPGERYVRLYRPFEVVEVQDDTVVMRNLSREGRPEVEETLERFEEEVEAGRAVLHPKCPYCGLPGKPGEMVGDKHYGCWFEGADVEERCLAEDELGNRLASRALRSGDARQWLLDYIGDPVNTFHDRCDAETLLSGAVPVRELIEAQAKCPNCMEGEYFPMDPSTGEVRCHCGEPMKGPDE